MQIWRMPMVAAFALGWGLFADMADAVEPPARDPLPPPSDAPEREGSCPELYALVPGKPVPPALLDAQGLVRCAAIAVPTSDYADDDARITAEIPALRARWRVDLREVDDLYRLDTSALERERDWYKGQAERLAEPPSFFERPAVARTTGRLEVLLVIGAFVAVDRALSP